MITYTGIRVTKDYGAPSLRDIAVQTMRLPRFCAAGELWYPVGLHLLLVADLLPKAMAAHALLHDAAESCVNDTPRPMKTDEAKAVEARVTERIYRNLGIRLPNKPQLELLHKADMRACNAEGCAAPGPRGFVDVQPDIDDLDLEARNKLTGYIRGFNPMDAINPNGHWPLLLERRLIVAVTAAQISSHNK